MKSPVRYLAAALRDEYGASEKANPDVASNPKLKGRAAILGRVRDLAAGRTPTQRDAEKRLFATSIQDPSARDDFDRHGWMSALNAKAISAFWEELFPDAFDGI